MATTRAEFGLRNSREKRTSLPPNGERPNRMARAAKAPPPTPGPEASPLEEAAEEGAAGLRGRGADPPCEALPPDATLRPSGSAPEESSRPSISAQKRSCAAAAAAAAVRAMRLPSPDDATAAGLPLRPQVFDTLSLVATSRGVAGRSHAKEAFAAAAGSRPEGGKPIVARPPSTPPGAPNAATGAGNDGPAAGIAPVTGGADIGPEATGASPPGSSV